MLKARAIVPLLELSQQHRQPSSFQPLSPLPPSFFTPPTFSSSKSPAFSPPPPSFSSPQLPFVSKLGFVLVGICRRFAARSVFVVAFPIRIPIFWGLCPILIAIFASFQVLLFAVSPNPSKIDKVVPKITNF